MEQKNIEPKLEFTVVLRDGIQLHDNQEIKSLIAYKTALKHAHSETTAQSQTLPQS